MYEDILDTPKNPYADIMDQEASSIPQMRIGTIPEREIEMPEPPEAPVLTSRDPMQRMAQNSYQLKRDEYNKRMAKEKAKLERDAAMGYPVSPEAAAFYGVELPEPPKPTKTKERVPEGIYSGPITQQMEQIEPAQDFREDGTLKGMGFLGPLKRPDGRVSTELSVGVELNGKETLIPTLVPTLTQEEINYLLNGGKPTDQIIDKSVDHAIKRIKEGLSPFASENEMPRGQPQQPISIAEFTGVPDEPVETEGTPIQITSAQTTIANQILSDQQLSENQKLIQLVNLMDSDPVSASANANYIQRAKRFISNYNEQVQQGTANVEALNLANEEQAVLRPIYNALKSVAGGLSLGATDIALKQVEDAYGGEAAPEGALEQTGAALGRLAGGIMTGRGIATGISGMLGKTGMSKTAQMIATRLLTNTAMQAAQQTTGLAAGTVKPEDYVGNLAQGIGASIPAMIAEFGLPQGLANSASQVMMDFLYDMSTDIVRGRLNPTENFQEWLMQELPNLAGSAIFALNDYKDPNFEVNRKMVKNEIMNMFRSDMTKHKLNIGGLTKGFKTPQEISKEAPAETFPTGLEPPEAKVREVPKEPPTRIELPIVEQPKPEPQRVELPKVEAPVEPPKAEPVKVVEGMIKESEQPVAEQITTMGGELGRATKESLENLREKVSMVRYGKPGEILFEFDGKTYSAKEPIDVMPAQDATGTNNENSRAWALKQILENTAKPIQGEPNALQKPVPEKVDVRDQPKDGEEVGRAYPEGKVAGEVEQKAQGKVEEVAPIEQLKGKIKQRKESAKEMAARMRGAEYGLMEWLRGNKIAYSKDISPEVWKELPLNIKGRKGKGHENLDGVARRAISEGIIRDSDTLNPTDNLLENIRRAKSGKKLVSQAQQEEAEIDNINERAKYVDDVEVAKLDVGDKYKDHKDDDVYTVLEVNDQSITVKDGEKRIIPIERAGSLNTIAVEKGSLKTGKKPKASFDEINKETFNLFSEPEKPPEIIAKEQIAEAKRVEAAKKAELERLAQELPGTKPTPELTDPQRKDVIDSITGKYGEQNRQLAEDAIQSAYDLNTKGKRPIDQFNPEKGDLAGWLYTRAERKVFDKSKQEVSAEQVAEPSETKTAPDIVAEKDFESRISKATARDRELIERGLSGEKLSGNDQVRAKIALKKVFGNSNMTDAQLKKLISKRVEGNREKLIDDMPVSPELKRKRGLRNRIGAIGFEPQLEVKPRQALDDVSKTQAMFNKQRQDIADKFRTKISDIRDKVSAAVFGSDVPITRRLMENNGKNVVIEKVLSRGWNERAKQEFNDAENAIKETIPHKLDSMFNDFIQAHRTIEVSNLMREKRGIQPELFAEGELPEVIKSPGGLGAKENRAWLDESRRQYPEEYKAMEKAQVKYNATMRKQIDKLLDNGLIDKEYHDYLVKNHQNFSPRKFIQHIDPSTDIVSGNKKLSVPDSGIEALDTGSDKSLINDTSYLLANTISRIEARIAKNNANKALYDYAESNKENPIGIKIENAKEAEKALSPDQTRISVMIDGKPKTMVGDTSIMKYWVDSDPHIKAQTANVFQWMSGVKVVKALATGYNPEFALYNIPRDLAHYWFTTQEYSKLLPVAWGQQLKDVIEVLPDVVKRTGRVKDYVNDGGGMSFLSSQGRLGQNKTGYGAVRNEAVRQVENIAGWLGQTSELLSRVALRERAIKNGKSSKEATYIARTALDFSQGGTAVKTLDTFVPYLNAGVQGTRGIVDAFKTNPKESIYKVAQLIGFSAVLEMLNQYMNKEANDSIPDAEKVSKFVITTPIYKKDKNGNKRFFYIPIPKDQGQQVFSIIGQELARKYMTGEASIKRIRMAMGNFIPADVQTSLPPIISAVLGYVSNKDFWSNRDIWEGRKVEPKSEFYATTPEAWKKTGEITGLSPERMRVTSKKLIPNNPLIYVMGGLQSPMESASDDTFTQRLFTLMTETPMLRRFMKTTFTTDLTEDDKKDAEKYKISMKYPDGTDKPKSLVKEEISAMLLKDNNVRQLNDVRLDMLMGQLRRKLIKQQEIEKWVESLDEKEIRRIHNRIKDKYRNLYQ